MQNLETLKPLAFIFLLLAVLVIDFLQTRWRAHVMRAFAERHGFSFRPGHRHTFFPSHEPPIPYTFRPHTYPANRMDHSWNVIQGEVKGLQILILDSNLNLGPRHQQTCTFIAAKAQVFPFPDRDASEQSVLTNGWFALYRVGFFGTPKTISINRLEKHLENFSPSKIDAP